MAAKPEYSDADIKQLIAIYEQAEKRIKELLLNANLADRAQKQFVLAQVQETLRDYQIRAAGQLTRQMELEFLAGIKETNELLNINTDQNFAVIDRRALEALVDEAGSTLKLTVNTSYQSIERTVNSTIRTATQQRVIEATGQSFVSGLDRNKLSREIVGALSQDGITGVVYRNGANHTLSNYAQMVARSNIRVAKVQGIIQSCLENGIDLVTVSSHGGASDLCGPWQGKILSITGKTPGYDSLEVAMTWWRGKKGTGRPTGLFHPNCRHIITPVIDDEGVNFERFNNLNNRYEQKKS